MTRLVALNEVERIMKIEEMILKAASGEMPWNRAAEVLGMSPRHLRRLRKRRKFDGLEGLQDRRRAPSPKRIPDEVVDEVLAYYRKECSGYNPTHFHEELLANKSLNEVYIPKHNKRFTVERASKETAFLPTKINLKYIFSIRNKPKVRKDNTVTLSNQVYQLPKLRRNRTMAGRTIEMRLCLDGSVVAMHGGQVISEITKK